MVWFSNCVPLALCPCIVLLPEQTKLLCCIEINVPVLNGEQKIHFFEAQSWFRHLFSWQIVAAEVWLIPFSLPFFFLLFQESVCEDPDSSVGQLRAGGTFWLQMIIASEWGLYQPVSGFPWDSAPQRLIFEPCAV